MGHQEAGVPGTLITSRVLTYSLGVLRFLKDKKIMFEILILLNRIYFTK